MSRRFPHTLTIVRTTFDDTPAARDEAGQPAATTTEVEVRGLVQPRRAEELADYRSAGSEISDHVIFLPPATELAGADAVMFGERRFQLTGIRRIEFGLFPHIEADAELITAPPVAVTSGGS